MIEDEAMGRFVVLKLSTFRKIIKWIVKKDWLKSRHLNKAERVAMDIREALTAGKARFKTFKKQNDTPTI